MKLEHTFYSAYKDRKYMATKHFECQECGAYGKIILKSEERLEDIVYCPVCSGDIYEEDDEEHEE